MKLYIKNMVCNRCKMAVETEFNKLGIQPATILLGEVILKEETVAQETLAQLKEALENLGFELMDDKKSKLIEQIKTFIIESIHYKHHKSPLNFSVQLAQHLHHDYSYLSKLFSETEGITIEQYLIQQKIERVKELLHYDEMPLSQIAIDLGYSSTAHLSAQFKKQTGLTPSHFKQLGKDTRKPLDEIGKKNLQA